MDDAKVADILSRALAAVNSAKIPNDLREVAFTRALSLLSAGRSDPSTVAEGAGNHAGDTGGTPDAPREALEPNSTGSALLDKVASGLGVDGAKVRRVFADKNGVPELIVKSGKLPKAKATAAHDIALLVMAGRQLGGLDTYTAAKVRGCPVRRGTSAAVS